MRIAILGATGLLGRELMGAVARSTAFEQVPVLLTPGRAELDLLDGAAVQAWLAAQRPRMVVLAAARVGGLAANLADPVGFLTQNVAMQTHVLMAAQACDVERLIWFGSSAMYPASAGQPMAEGALLGGPLDPALRPYSLAKLCGVELTHALNRECAARGDALRALCLIPPNLFGVHDRFDEGATVLPSLMRRVAEARVEGRTTLSVWGTGRARRELLPAAELARAALHFLTLPEAVFGAVAATLPGAGDTRWPVLNTGAGFDLSIGELAETVCRALDTPLQVSFDASRPEGTLRKLLDSSRAAELGWEARFSLEGTIREVYAAARAAGRLP